MRTILTLFLLLFPLALPAQKLSQRVLMSSTFQVLGYGGLSQSCGGSGCTVSIPLVTPASVVCPRPAGSTCTFAIDVQAFVGASSPPDIGLLTYTGDGSYIDKRTNPSYTFQSGRVPSPSEVSASFTFVVTVKNTNANQQHPVEIDLVCIDTDGDGCFVGSGGVNRYYPSASVRIDVFRP